MAWLYGIVLAIIAAVNVSLITLLGKDYKKNKNQHAEEEKKTNFLVSFIIGFVADFFNALGVGSFATTASLNSFWRQVSDKLLPGTLVIGISGLAEPFTTIIPLITNIWPSVGDFLGIKDAFSIDALTLLLLFVGAAIGGIWGARIVSSWPSNTIQRYMGFGLGVVAIIMLLKNIPQSADSTGAFLSGDFKSLWNSLFGESASDLTKLKGFALIIAFIGQTFFGMIQNIGIGYYAPTLALLPLLGMSTKTALFVAYTGCAIASNFSGIGFVHSGQYNRKATLAFLIAGAISTLIAVLLIGSMPTIWLNRIVNVLLFYVSFSMLKASSKA